AHDGRQLGRAGIAHARQLRRVYPLCLFPKMAGSERRIALGAVLHRLRDWPAEEILRFLPEERKERLGQAAPRPAERPPPRREVRAAPRERMASGPHEVDEVLPA